MKPPIPVATAVDAGVKHLENASQWYGKKRAALLEQMRMLLAAPKKLNQAQMSWRTTSKSQAIN